MSRLRERYNEEIVPALMAELGEIYGTALVRAIEGWRDGDLTDGQAVFSPRQTSLIQSSKNR